LTSTQCAPPVMVPTRTLSILCCVLFFYNFKGVKYMIGSIHLSSGQTGRQLGSRNLLQFLNLLQHVMFFFRELLGQLEPFLLDADLDLELNGLVKSRGFNLP